MDERAGAQHRAMVPQAGGRDYSAPRPWPLRVGARTARTSPSPDGAESGDDRVVGLSCDYMCVWVGAEEIGNAAQWIAGMFRA
jgi:hypothetical protein